MKLATLLAALLVLCSSGAAWALPICERTSQVRDRIVTETRTDSCEDVDARARSRIHSLYLWGLSGRPISSLKAGDFDGLISLRRLYLDENGVTMLPARVFDGWASLEAGAQREFPLRQRRWLKLLFA